MGTGLYPKLTELLSSAGCFLDRQGKGRQVSKKLSDISSRSREFLYPYVILLLNDGSTPLLLLIVITRKATSKY